ncbi:hypothetical protein [Sulfobacillus thermosulfidooxidans]|uniref:Uncharacterized protein n=1 Tax=Sulfobacillus thermosulfidooxidans TaxID=28034 RepID=A0A1R0IQ43_SULTH|nr:hypothetical protein [Sulfobacillus thermosulfidooxidans]OLZ09980.1 hypothetical protein BFX05_13800 [Sulfobacillus thermosulfidooxidans]OLZ15715.1 hypothetical protein BFX06_01240 [Sulfobacillus thermosulfidooxidans]OLZ18438.1 hypothetical protein BFX07_08885 [Sulfobacillus thermosulfidooxidans]PSR28210.1 MAG: hypothetical protein C7B47_05765 [Sulfobacillus thermosulfidooxidans]
MEVTLSQLIESAPELAVALRTDIRKGKLAAKRQEGVAGRPYVVDTQALMQSDREAFRQLAQDLEAGREVVRSRNSNTGRIHHTPTIGNEANWQPFMKIMESQQSMMSQLLEVLTDEMRHRQERVDRQAREMQELSYKLGQSHQQIERLERLLKDHAENHLEQA